MRNKLRAIWHHLQHEVRLALTACNWCGQRGVEHTSYDASKGLCHECGLTYEKVLNQLGSSAAVKDFQKEYGYREVYRQVSEFKEEPLAYGLVPEDDEEEIPCFDTYPAPPPQNL